MFLLFFFFQAEDGIRDRSPSRGLGDVYKRQVCGVVPALGACYSVLVGARCGLGPQTMATMELTGKLGLVTAEHAEPGCCKAYVRACLATTTEYIRETLDIELPGPAHARCLHHTQHPHGCRGFACPWYPDVSTGQDAGLQEAGDGG